MTTPPMATQPVTDQQTARWALLALGIPCDQIRWGKHLDGLTVHCDRDTHVLLWAAHLGVTADTHWIGHDLLYLEAAGVVDGQPVHVTGPTRRPTQWERDAHTAPWQEVTR